MTTKLLDLLPEHTRYVEVFGGGASLLFAKPPCAVETYNDLDGGLVNFFRVVRDPDLFPEFQRRAQLTPYARQEYNDARAWWKDPANANAEPLERAWNFYLVARMSFSGHFGASWSSVVALSRRGMAGTASNWLSVVANLPAIHKRLLRVQIENSDWRTILHRYNGPGYLAYCDPPYVHETRSAGGYAHDAMTVEDHAEMVEALLAYDGSVMLSGYDHPVYQPLTEHPDWAKYTFETACSAAAKTRATGLQGQGAALAKQPRTEIVWIKDQGATSLFDRKDSRCEAPFVGSAEKAT